MEFEVKTGIYLKGEKENISIVQKKVRRLNPKCGVANTRFYTWFIPNDLKLFSQKSFGSHGIIKACIKFKQ
jgi:hypothetical protein